jgi:hypothetical protein
MELTVMDTSNDLMAGLRLRGLTLPVGPTPIGPGRDDRDLLWEAYTRSARDGVVRAGP